MNQETPRVILLFGPTAVGKSTSLYTHLDSRFEIINADSMQIYKYMDIGTAKPSPGEQALLPHHLVDILDPSEQFTVGEFLRRVVSLIQEVNQRGRVPVLCGGTAFYLKSFLFPMAEDLPAASPEIREKVRLRAEAIGPERLYSELQKVDPVYAGKIAPQDLYRVTRALEVFEQTGRPLSSFAPPEQMRQDYRILLIGLDRPREELFERIDLRVELMFRQGLVDEVKRLIARGYTEQDPGMRGIGYKEFFDMQKYSFPLAEVKRLIQRNSRHYAKRQMTFFRRFPDVHWVHPGEGEQIRKLIDDFLSC